MSQTPDHAPAGAATATQVAGGGSGDDARDELPFHPAPIEELMRLLVKAVRAHQLYLPNNPVYKGAIDAVRAAFPALWAHTDGVSLTFTETDIRWLGHSVLHEASRAGDSLPWTFFKDGVREVTITRGFEEQELESLLDILQRVRKALPEEDDLLTLLWQADFAYLRYRYVDLGAEPAPPIEAGAAGDAGDGQQVSADAVQSAMREPLEESRPSIVNMQDFDATLYFLDDQELAYLRAEIEREYQSDLQHSVATILFDIFEAQQAPAVREEVTGLVEHLLLMLLSAGRLRTVAYLLAESQQVVKRAAGITPEQADRMGRLSERLSAPEPLSQLLQALDESAELPPQQELTLLFEQLGATALGTVLAWLPRLQNARVREVVEQAAERLASAHTAELVSLIGSDDRAVVSEAIRRAGAMRTAAAAAPLGKVLAHPDASIRLLAAQALADIGSAGALQALEPAIHDRDREVRVLAARTLGAKGVKRVAPALESIVKGKALRAADLTERMTFFEAYGSLCGDAGVPYLDEVLNGKSLFGRREEPELRACAAIALGRVGSAPARAALQRASAEKDVVVRNAVARALRGGTGGGTRA